MYISPMSLTVHVGNENIFLVNDIIDRDRNRLGARQQPHPEVPETYTVSLILFLFLLFCTVLNY